MNETTYNNRNDIYFHHSSCNGLTKQWMEHEHPTSSFFSLSREEFFYP
jgi:hypothetical protein